MKIGTLVLLLALAGTAAAQDRQQIERRVQSVATLIESSSATRQIETSGVAAAREKRDNAKLLHREAAAALAAGDLAGSSKLLDQAARELIDGARLARPEQVVAAKNRVDFDARLGSAEALLAAQQRIVQEKGASAQTREATTSIRAAIDQAKTLAAAGRIDDARAPLDRAYLSARVSIEALRRGDTLVRSLHFANPREEYDYEIDRNDTHRMLIKVLLADRKESATLMQPAIERAAALRGQAEGQAQRGEHGAAIKTLEDSTRELVRAIRAGGVYIPG